MRVIVFGAGLAGLKAWIALSQLAQVEVVAFLDNDPNKRDTNLCGIPVHGVESLATVEYDAVLVASLSANAIRTQLLGQGIPESRLHVVDPGKDLGSQLRSRGLAVGSRKPFKRSSSSRIAIFGAGMAGLHAWESLAHRPDVEVVAFVDNDDRRQRSQFLGVRVLSPLDLEAHGFDAIVIASVHAGAIARDLLRLGFDDERIMTVELFEWLLDVRYTGNRLPLRLGGPPALGQELGC